MSPLGFKTIRQAHGSQRAVSKLLGIGFRTLQRCEDGTNGDPVPLKFQNMLRGLPSPPTGIS